MGAGGNFAQIGFAEETAWGTARTPSTFLEFLNEGIKQEIKRLESAGLRARRVRHSSQWAQGGKRVAGPVSFEVADSGFGLLLKHMFGAVSTSGVAAPYTHTFTPGNLPPGMTIQVGRPQLDGTVQAFTYAGCRLASWELGLAVDQIAQLQTEWVGKSESTATALAVASYPAGDLLTFIGGAITIGGSPVDLKELNITGENALLGERWYLGSDQIKQPVENGYRQYGGSVLADFNGLTLYNRFVNGEEAALVATLADPTGAHHLRITANVRFDGETPNVTGPEFLEQSLPFTCIASGASDATAITAEYLTADAAV